MGARKLSTSKNRHDDPDFMSIGPSSNAFGNVGNKRRFRASCLDNSLFA